MRRGPEHLSEFVPDRNAVMDLQTRLSQEKGSDGKPLYTGKIDGLAGDLTTKAMQTLLSRPQYGYDKAIDGDFGERSQAAMQRWAAENPNVPAAHFVQKQGGAQPAAHGASVNPYAVLREPHADTIQTKPAEAPQINKEPKPFIRDLTPPQPHGKNLKGLSMEGAQNTGVPFNPDKAIQDLHARVPESKVKSGRECATYVRQALVAGGLKDINNDHPIDAKNYGPCLEKNGFSALDKGSYEPRKGDVAVIQNYKGGNSSGHITMFDGKKWVSDFRQQNDGPGRDGGILPGPGYAQARPSYKIYRHDSMMASNDALESNQKGASHGASQRNMMADQSKKAPLSSQSHGFQMAALSPAMH